jgi:hypothetical protein
MLQQPLQQRGLGPPLGGAPQGAPTGWQQRPLTHRLVQHWPLHEQAVSGTGWQATIMQRLLVHWVGQAQPPQATVRVAPQRSRPVAIPHSKFSRRHMSAASSVPHTFSVPPPPQHPTSHGRVGAGQQG